MTNKEFHTLLLQNKDDNNCITNSLMNKIVIENKGVGDNLYELISQGKIIKTVNGYIIKK